MKSLKSQTPQIITYKPVKDKGCYVVKVSCLFGDLHKYRVDLSEEYDYHTSQITDVHLRRPSDRRWLEQYIKDLSKRVRIAGIYFGDNVCYGTNHYPLDVFVEQHAQWKEYDYLKDLHLDIDDAPSNH